jgi:hypothetical protein
VLEAERLSSGSNRILTTPHIQANQPETVMNASLETAAATTRGKTWGAMDVTEKLTFLGKICIMIASSGFIFGNIFVD